jgi:hypothetical protein
MTTRLGIVVAASGAVSGFTLAWSTWSTDRGGISLPASASMEELAPMGVNFNRFRIESYKFQDIEGIGTVGVSDYNAANTLSDQCVTSIGRICSLEHTFGSIKTYWSRAMIVEAVPKIGSATVTDNTSATAYVQCRFKIRRLPDG